MKIKTYRKLGINALLNMLRIGLSILFPIVTYPYAFRVLHAEGIGKVNYASSIVNYFSLIAAFGITDYAVREGAKLRDDREKFGIFANQIFTINIGTTIFSYSILGVLLVNSVKLYPYKELIILSSLTIVFNTIGVEWLNTIYEDYLYIAIRSIIAQGIMFILLFILVRDEKDVYQYALLTVIFQGAISLMNLIYCKRYVRLHITKHLCVTHHLKPILLLAVNKVAISIYVNLDVTMLGWYVGDYYIGVYEIAVKIYTTIKTMLAAIYTVFVPRFSYYIGQKDVTSIKNVYTTLVSALTLLVFPVSLGLSLVAREIILIMGGVEYIEAVLALRILSISLIGAVFGGVITVCLNFPLGRERINIQATVLSAIINAILNVVIIPQFKQNGAAITTMISEFFVLAYCFLKFKEIKEYLDMKKWRSALFHAVIGCALIFLGSIVISHIVVNIVIRILSIVLGGAFVYLTELILLKDEFVCNIIDRLKINYIKDR